MNKSKPFRALKAKARARLKAATEQYEKTLEIIELLSTKAVAPKEIDLTGEYAQTVLSFGYDAKSFKGLLKAYPAKPLVYIEDAQKVVPESSLSAEDKRKIVRPIYPYVGEPGYKKGRVVNWFTDLGDELTFIQVDGVTEKQFVGLFKDKSLLTYDDGLEYCLKATRDAAAPLQSPFTAWRRHWDTFAYEQHYSTEQMSFLDEIKRLISYEHHSAGWKEQGLPDKHGLNHATPFHWSEPFGTFWDHFDTSSARVFWKFCLEMEKAWFAAIAESARQSQLVAKALSELFRKGTPHLSGNMMQLLGRYIRHKTGVTDQISFSLSKDKTEMYVSFLFADDPKTDYRCITRLDLPSRHELLPRDILFEYVD